MKINIIKRVPVLTLIILFLLSVEGNSQVNVELMLSPTLQNAQVVYISNFDFPHRGQFITGTNSKILLFIIIFFE